MQDDHGNLLRGAENDAPLPMLSTRFVQADAPAEVVWKTHCGSRFCIRRVVRTDRNRDSVAFAVDGPDNHRHVVVKRACVIRVESGALRPMGAIWLLY